MSLSLRVKARAVLLSELAARTAEVPDPTFAHPVLEHVVGRTVAVIGDPEVGLLDLLEQSLYRVFVLEEGERLAGDAMVDSIIVCGRSLEDFEANELDELISHALWSVVFFDCDGAESLELRGLAKFPDRQLYVLEKYADSQDGELLFSAAVRLRSKTADGWDYHLSLADSDQIIRATGDEEFSNNAVVFVQAESIITSQDSDLFGVLDAKVLRSDDDAHPDSVFALLSRAACRNLLRDGVEVTTSEELARHANVPVEKLTDARRVLRGFLGTQEEAVELLRERFNLNGVQADDLLGLEVSQFKATGDTLPHRVIGVVLEPETPYGPHGVWFPRETIEAIQQQQASAALNHENVSDDHVRIVSTVIDENGEHAKPGSLLVECEVAEDVYDGIVTGAYRGFSIRGSAVLAGSGGAKE